jgi:hypothetical protein
MCNSSMTLHQSTFFIAHYFDVYVKGPGFAPGT